MNKKLGEEDRRAVDLLLDGKRVSAGATEVFVQPGPVDTGRLQSVEKILATLEHLPTIDPPADLTDRTLRRVDAALASLDAASHTIFPSSVGNQERPTA